MKDEKKLNQDTNDTAEYTVQELIQELMTDASWEPDPEYRRKAIGLLMKNVIPFC